MLFICFLVNVTKPIGESMRHQAEIPGDDLRAKVRGHERAREGGWG